MAGFNGSGTYVRSFDWTDDAANGIPITASRCDTEDDGFATGLSTAITKDGQTTVTANLPMATFRHTGVGNGAARTDYLALGQAQDSSVVHAGTVGGTADAITLTLSPAITAYAAGQSFSFVATGTNTGATTVDVNSVGAKAVQKLAGAALAAGDIQNGDVIDIVYDGTQFRIVGQHGSAAAVRTTLSVPSYAGLDGWITGGIPSNAADADHDLTFTAGYCINDAADDLLAIPAYTKQFDATFAEGTAAGGMASGQSIPTSARLYVFLVSKDADGTIDIMGDVSSTGANANAGWTVERCLGAFPCDGSANIRPFSAVAWGGGAVLYTLKDPPLDLSTTILGTSESTTPLSVGGKAEVVVHINFIFANGSANAAIYMRDPAANDEAPSASAAPLASARVISTSINGAGTDWIRTDGSGQIKVRADAASTTLRIATLGWLDPRP